MSDTQITIIKTPNKYKILGNKQKEIPLYIQPEEERLQCSEFSGIDFDIIELSLEIS